MKKTIFGLILLLVAGLAIDSTTFTVSEREYAIVTEFGRVAQVITTPGLSFKKPGFMNRVHRLDRRTQILNTQVIQLLFGDKNPVVLSCYVLWRISDPEKFFTRLQSTAAATPKLEAMVTSHLGSVLGGYKVTDILLVEEQVTATQSQLMTIEELVRQRAHENAVQEYGLEIRDVGIRRLAYPAQVTDAVYQRMRAERRKEANKIRAEGREEATKIRARTNKDAAEIFAVAKEKAEIIMGEGDKVSMKTYAEAYGQNQEYFRFTKSLELYSNVLQMNSLLVFSTNSGLFSYLGNMDRSPFSGGTSGVGTLAADAAATANTNASGNATGSETVTDQNKDTDD